MRALRNRKRTHQKKTKPATLNLVSLMDIFTILVFFLMFNSSDVQVIETSNDIKLPESVAEQKPDQRLVISVNEDDLMVQGRVVASIKRVMSSNRNSIVGLRHELALLADAKKQKLSPGATFEGAVTIMGDRTLPYELLKRIMLTCQQTNHTRIALAVIQVSGKEA